MTLIKSVIKTCPTEVKVVGIFHVPFTEFLGELGCRGRHTECACYFCRNRQSLVCPVISLVLSFNFSPSAFIFP